MMPEFFPKIDQQQAARIDEIASHLQKIYPNVMGPYREKRGMEIGSWGRKFEANTLQKIAADLMHIQGIESKGETTLFAGREYIWMNVAKLPSNKEIAALFPDPGVSKTNFAVFPDALPAVPSRDTSAFHQAYHDITARSLDTWLKFARLVGQLPPVEGQVVNVGGIKVTSLERLFTASFHSAVYWKAETKSSVYTHMGPSEFDTKVGYHSTDLKSYKEHLEETMKEFRMQHFGVIKHFDLIVLLKNLEAKARDFKGTYREEPDPMYYR